LERHVLPPLAKLLLLRVGIKILLIEKKTYAEDAMKHKKELLIKQTNLLLIEPKNEKLQFQKLENQKEKFYAESVVLNKISLLSSSSL